MRTYAVAGRAGRLADTASLAILAELATTRGIGRTPGMATRRRRSLEGTVDRTAVLLEQIHEQNRATIEAVQSQGTSIRREMGEMRRELLLRIEALEGSVRQNSADIRKNSEDLRQHSEVLTQHSGAIRQNSEEIRQMKAQLVEMTAVLRAKPDAASLEKLEARVSALERRVGI